MSEVHLSMLAEPTDMALSAGGQEKTIVE